MKPVKDTANPLHWPEDKLLGHAAQNGINLTGNSSKEDKADYRHLVWGAYMREQRLAAANVMRERKEKARKLYEKGAGTQTICKACKIPLKKLITWIHNRNAGDRWMKPGEEPLPMHAPIALPEVKKPEEIKCVSLVTAEDEEQLSEPVKELRREMRLMNLQGKQWAEVSYADRKEALEIQIVGLAVRIIEKMKRMDDAELIDKEVVKTLVMMQQIKVNATPKAEVAPRNSAVLHAFVMNGDAALPPRARVREIEAG